MTRESRRLKSLEYSTLIIEIENESELFQWKMNQISLNYQTDLKLTPPLIELSFRVDHITRII